MADKPFWLLALEILVSKDKISVTCNKRHSLFRYVTFPTRFNITQQDASGWQTSLQAEEIGHN